MSSQLEELVEFLHHGNAQIRQVAAENLVAFSVSDPNIFKQHDLTPIKDLKLLVKDYTPIAKNALNILINLSSDSEILASLTGDKGFVETLLSRLQSPKEPNANEFAMLLANMAKSDAMLQLLTLKRGVSPHSSSDVAVTQLIDLFVKGADKSVNPAADYDYLAYVFSSLAHHKKAQTFLATTTENSSAPIVRIAAFTSDPSEVRRNGVAAAIKNTAFHIQSHSALLDPGRSVLPHILLPLADGTDDTYNDEDKEGMPAALKSLDPTKKRETDAEILKTHLESLILLGTTREGRDAMRNAKVYPVIRELHLRTEDPSVREECERVVDLIMRDEEGEVSEDVSTMQKELDEKRRKEIQEEEEDKQVVDIF